MLLTMVYLLICIRFFFSKKYVSPIPVYFMAGIDGGLGTVGYLSELMTDISNELLRDIVMLNSLRIMEKVIISILLVVIAFMLDKKRKLAVK